MEILPCIFRRHPHQVYSSFDEHLNRLRTVFGRLRPAGVKLKPNKCHYLRRRVNFLGHVISNSGIETDPEKIKALKDWPTPKNVKELRNSLGVIDTIANS